LQELSRRSVNSQGCFWPIKWEGH